MSAAGNKAFSILRGGGSASDKAAFAGAVRQPARFNRPMRGVAIGHSIINGNGSHPDNLYPSNAVWTALQWFAQGLLNFAPNAGVPGETSFAISRRFQQEVVAMRPDFAFIDAWTNDVNPDGTLRTNPAVNPVAACRAMLLLCASRGILPIVQSMMPRGASEGVALADTIIAINTGLAAVCDEFGAVFIDVNRVLTDASGRYWIDATYSADNTHPTTKAAIIAGREAYNQLVAKGVLPLFKSGAPLPNYLANIPNDQFDLVPNGTFMPQTNGDTNPTGATGTWFAPAPAAGRTTTRNPSDGWSQGNFIRHAWNAGATTGAQLYESANVSIPIWARGRRFCVRLKARKGSATDILNSIELFIRFKDRNGANMSAGATGRLVSFAPGDGYLQVEVRCPASAHSYTLQAIFLVNNTTESGYFDIAEASMTEVYGLSGVGNAPTNKLPRVSRTVTASSSLADRTMTIGDDTLLVDTTAGAVTVIAPKVADNLYGLNTTYGGVIQGDGQEYKIVKLTADANTVTIQTQGSDTIQGASSVTLTTQYAVAKLHSVQILAGVGLYLNG